MRAVRIIFVAGLVATLPPAVGAVTFGVTDLGDLGGSNRYSTPYDLNNSGEVVGRSYSAEGARAFFWDSAGGMVDLGTLSGGGLSLAMGLNDAGQVVGWSSAASGIRAFVWDKASGMKEYVDVPDGTSLSAAAEINNSSQAVGWTKVDGKLRAALWEADGTLKDLGDPAGKHGQESQAYGINDNGQVVGQSGSTAFLWDSENGMVDLGSLPLSTSYPLAQEYSIARAINADGQVAGLSNTSNTNVSGREVTIHAFLWDEDTGMTDLGDLPGGNDESHIYAEGLNDAGQVVGWSSGEGAGGYAASSRAFLWQEDTGMLDLNDLLEPGTGWFLGEARAINDLGQIVAYGTKDGARHALLLTPDTLVPGTGSGDPANTPIPNPLPAPLLLLATAGAAMGLAGRRRRLIPLP